MEVNVKTIDEAADRLKSVVKETPLQLSKRLSKKYHARVYLKREDLQEIRSFKIRGSFNKISSLSAKEKSRGIVTSSAGNHAQGVASSCATLHIHGTIFMPSLTPTQKIMRVKHFGGKYITIQLVGNTFDDAQTAGRAYAKEHHLVFVSAFDDPLVIQGQGTIAKEIYEKLEGVVDYVIVPIGGGGLIAGIGSYLKERNPKIMLIGVEPHGAESMKESLKRKKISTLQELDTFVDGVAIKTPGKMTFPLCQRLLDKSVVVDNGLVCTVMIELYQNEGIIAEPAGALAVSSLDAIAKEIRGKTVVCVVSGGNNDILRYPEIMEKSLVYQGRKYYFLIEFAQKPGQLRNFLNLALGPHDDIVLFEYTKKTNKGNGPALIGIELADKEDYTPLITRMKTMGLNFTKLKSDDLLYNFLI